MTFALNVWRGRKELLSNLHISTKDDYHKNSFWFLLSSFWVLVLFSFRISRLQPATWIECSLFQSMVCWTENLDVKLFFWLCTYVCFKYTCNFFLSAVTFTWFGDDFSLLEILVFLVRPDLLSKLCKCMWICVYACDFEHISHWSFLGGGGLLD